MFANTNNTNILILLVQQGTEVTLRHKPNTVGGGGGGQDRSERGITQASCGELLPLMLSSHEAASQ